MKNYSQNLIIDSLNSFIENTIEDTVIARTHILLSKEWDEINLDSSFYHINEAIELAIFLDDNSILLKSIIHKNYLFFISVKNNEALKLNYHFQEYFERRNFLEGYLEITSHIARIYRYMNNIDSANVILSEIIKKIPKNTQIERLIYFKTISYIDIAYINSHNGVYVNSLTSLDSAKLLLMSFKAIELEFYLNNTYGVIYQFLNEKQLSYQYLEKNLYEVSENFEANAIHNLCVANIHFKDFDKAEERALKGLKIVRKQNLDFLINKFNYLLVQIYYESEQFDNAFLYANDMLDIAKKLNGTKDVAISNNYLGSIYNKYNQPVKAEMHCLRSWKLIEETNRMNVKLSACKCLYESYKSSGDIEKAFPFYEKYNYFKDSVNYKDEIQDALVFKEQKELKIIKQESKSQELLSNQKIKNQQYIIIASFLGLSILILGIYFLYKLSKEKTKTALLVQKEKDTQDNLIQNIVHEFRTPLTLIKGPINELQTEQDEKIKKTLFKLIDRNSDKMLSLVNQLLDLAKLKIGKLSLVTEIIDLNLFLGQIVDSFQTTADRKNIELKFHSCDINTFSDTDKLNKIITNLISNAIKFTPKNGEIDVFLEGDKDQYFITVKDTGIGIPKKEHTKIFERYYQSDATITRHAEGTGIGLSLVNELVKLMSGKLNLESKEGEGTIIKIEFINLEKYKIEEKIFVKPIHSALDEKQNLISRISKEEDFKILIVEDNEDLRYYLRSLIEKVGYNCIGSENGKEGFEKAISEIPDIIISDVMMPIMDGYQLLEKVKSNEFTNHIPVIMLTAKASFDSKMKGLQLGADEYLAKPFSSEELMLRINNIIELRNKIHQKFNTSSHPKLNEFVVSFIKIIDDNLSEENFGIANITDLMNISRSQLNRKLKALTNFSPNQFIVNYKMDIAMKLLKEGNKNASEIGYHLGFSSLSYFGKVFKEYYGKSPSDIK